MNGLNPLTSFPMPSWTLLLQLFALLAVGGFGLLLTSHFWAVLLLALAGVGLTLFAVRFRS